VLRPAVSPLLAAPGGGRRRLPDPRAVCAPPCLLPDGRDEHPSCDAQLASVLVHALPLRLDQALAAVVYPAVREAAAEVGPERFKTNLGRALRHLYYSGRGRYGLARPLVAELVLCSPELLAALGQRRRLAPGIDELGEVCARLGLCGAGAPAWRAALRKQGHLLLLLPDLSELRRLSSDGDYLAALERGARPVLAQHAQFRLAASRAAGLEASRPPASLSSPAPPHLRSFSDIHAGAGL
jgi:hypothetical protein